MATKYECDKCNQQFSDRDDIRRVILPQMDKQQFVGEDAYSRDLCHKCCQGITEYIQYKNAVVQIYHIMPE